jgi:hypothetical protein
MGANISVPPSFDHRKNAVEPSGVSDPWSEILPYEMPSSLEAEPVDDAPVSLKRPLFDGYCPFIAHSNP